MRSRRFVPPTRLLALAIAALGSLCAAASDSPAPSAAESGPRPGAVAAERPPDRCSGRRRPG